MTQANKRQREETDNPVILSIRQTKQLKRRSKTNNISYNTHQKEKVNFKLNYLNDEKAKHEAHYEFITRCQKEKIIPDGLKVYLESSIGNNSGEFLNNMV